MYSASDFVHGNFHFIVLLGFASNKEKFHFIIKFTSFFWEMSALLFYPILVNLRTIAVFKVMIPSFKGLKGNMNEFYIETEFIVMKIEQDVKDYATIEFRNFLQGCF